MKKTPTYFKHEIYDYNKPKKISFDNKEISIPISKKKLETNILCENSLINNIKLNENTDSNRFIEKANEIKKTDIYDQNIKNSYLPAMENYNKQNDIKSNIENIDFKSKNYKPEIKNFKFEDKQFKIEDKHLNFEDKQLNFQDKQLLEDKQLKFEDKSLKFEDKNIKFMDLSTKYNDDNSKFEEKNYNFKAGNYYENKYSKNVKINSFKSEQNIYNNINSAKKNENFNLIKKEIPYSEKYGEKPLKETITNSNSKKNLCIDYKNSFCDNLRFTENYSYNPNNNYTNSYKLNQHNSYNILGEKKYEPNEIYNEIKPSSFDYDKNKEKENKFNFNKEVLKTNEIFEDFLKLDENKELKKKFDISYNDNKEILEKKTSYCSNMEVLEINNKNFNKEIPKKSQNFTNFNSKIDNFHIDSLKINNKQKENKFEDFTPVYNPEKNYSFYETDNNSYLSTNFNKFEKINNNNNNSFFSENNDKFNFKNDNVKKYFFEEKSQINDKFTKKEKNEESLINSL